MEATRGNGYAPVRGTPAMMMIWSLAGNSTTSALDDVKPDMKSCVNMTVAVEAPIAKKCTDILLDFTF